MRIDEKRLIQSLRKLGAPARRWVPDISVGHSPVQAEALLRRAQTGTISAAQVFNLDAYFVNYLADALPDVSTPAWTEYVSL